MAPFKRKVEYPFPLNNGDIVTLIIPGDGSLSYEDGLRLAAAIEAIATPETFPNNKGSGGDKTPAVQPTPESNIEELTNLLADYWYEKKYEQLNSVQVLAISKLSEIVQALLTAADQAGYTRGRGEAKISPIIEMPLDITGFQLIGYFGKDGGEWRSVIFGTEVLPAKLQKEQI